MIRLLVFLYVFGAVASDKESTTVTIGTPSTTLTNLSKNITNSSGQDATTITPDISTLPSLPKVGEAKSRRKPNFRKGAVSDSSEEKIQNQDEKVLHSKAIDKKKIVAKKKDGTTKPLALPKKTLQSNLDIKSSGSNPKDNIKHLKNLKNTSAAKPKMADTSGTKKNSTTKTNIVSEDKSALKIQNTGPAASPATEKTTTDMKNKNLKVENTELKPTTQTAFNIDHSVVKIVTLTTPRSTSKHTTTKSTLLNVEIPKVSVGPTSTPSVDKKPTLAKDGEPKNEENGSTGLIVGVFFGLILTSVLVFVGLKRLDAIRRRREYRRMNDFLIDGMYNDA